jgi:hypothetical protein
MVTIRRALLAAGCILPLAVPSPARAQSTSSTPPAEALPAARPWTVEIHGGAMRGVAPTGGGGQLPPYGGSFQAANGDTSPAVSSWYFGDGAKWLNYFTSPSSSLAVKPLDSVLTSPALQRQRGPLWGVRVTRELSHHLDVEVAIDRAQGSNVLSTIAATGLQSSVNSYQSVWRFLLGGLPSNSVSSALSVTDNVGRQTFATSAVDFVFGEHRWARYVSVGGGLVVNTGTPVATLTGTVGFAINGRSALQSDTVTIRFAERHVQPAGTFGGGVIYYATPRSGFRVDGRVYIHRVAGQTFLSTSPSTSGTPNVVDLLNPANGVIEFSGLSTSPSTLSQTVTNVQTYGGGGVTTHLSLSIGYFFRF